MSKLFAVIVSVISLLALAGLVGQTGPRATSVHPVSGSPSYITPKPHLADFSTLIDLIHDGSPSSTTLTLGPGGGTIVHNYDNTREDQPQIRWILWANGSLFVTRLTLERIRSTPKWTHTNADGAENPPLSARNALENAAVAIKNEICPYGADATYRTPVLKLQQFDTHWFWVVYFTPDNIPMDTKPFPVVVLMDGSVLQPTSGPSASFLQDANGGMGGSPQ